MPPRLPRIPIGLSRKPIVSVDYNALQIARYADVQQQICLFCTAGLLTRGRQSRKQHLAGLRSQSTESNLAGTSIASIESRAHLKDALAGLQKQAGSYINVSRLNLALRALEQPPGQETIRIAILALADGGTSLKKAKQLVRAFIADPLNGEEEEWERALMDDETGSKPLLFKIGKHDENEVIQRNALLQEFHVQSPLLNSHNLEILVLEVDPPLKEESSGGGSFANTVLVPTMVTPISNSGRHIPITLPAHKSLVLADGIMGAATLMSHLSDDVNQEMVKTAVNFPTAIKVGEQVSSLPFQVLDIAKGDGGLQAFRKNIETALDYETKWYESGLGDVLEWLRDGTETTQGELKPPVRKLIESILKNAGTAHQVEHLRQLSAALSLKITSSKLHSLQSGLAEWSEQSHKELRDELDIAFNGHRWRKLGWWKLFWRVDDVSMIATDILNQRFLTDAEKEVIFLSGRFQEAGIYKDLGLLEARHWAYRPVAQEPVSGPPPPTYKELKGIPKDVPATSNPKPWPLDIPITRSYLSANTVPALQALAQKLTIQTLSTSVLTSALAGLIYLSTLSTTFYEAGAVAAVGIVWSMRRMQGKWETARSFWEGEVREEGRKAVKDTEAALGQTLIPREAPLKGGAELVAARKALESADAALKACK
jgi:hypothetical protein